jgi:hypothetical protein
MELEILVEVCAKVYSEDDDGGLEVRWVYTMHFFHN